MKNIIQQKLKAAGVHFLASVCVVTGAALLCAFLWFPAWVYKNDLLEGFKLIAVVDVVLGPLLTLVVYNAAKASLKYDLGVIVLVQLAALGYGVHTVYSQRPVVQVLSFDGVTALRTEDVQMPEGISPTVKINGVPTYYLDLPPSVEGYESLKLTYEIVGESMAANVELYKPIVVLAEPLKGLYLSGDAYDEAGKCYRLPFEFRASNAEGCFAFE